MADKIIAKNVKIEDIQLGDRARTNFGDLAALKESISQKGVIQPITLTPELKLLAGGRRLAACKELEMTTIPAILRKIEGEIDELEIELVENIARKDFDWVERAKLEKRIYDLKLEENPDWTQDDQAEYLGQSKGATSRRIQLAEIMEAVPQLMNAPDESTAWKGYKKLESELIIREIAKEADPEVTRGAQYAEKHYHVGDAIEGLKGMNDRIVHFAEVDPPYGIDFTNRKERNVEKQNIGKYTEVDSKEYLEFIETVATEVYRVLYDPSFCVWWFGPTWYKEVREILRGVGFQVNDIPAIWIKRGGGQTASPDTMLGSSYEPFLVCRKGNPVLAKPGRSNLFDFEPVSPSKKIHATEKPFELMDEILKTFSYPGGVMVCPFLGSGVTLRAAYANSTIGFGWDLSPENKRLFVSRVMQDIQNRPTEKESIDD